MTGADTSEGASAAPQPVPQAAPATTPARQRHRGSAGIPARSEAGRGHTVAGAGRLPRRRPSWSSSSWAGSGTGWRSTRESSTPGRTTTTTSGRASGPTWARPPSSARSASVSTPASARSTARPRVAGGSASTARRHPLILCRHHHPHVPSRGASPRAHPRAAPALRRVPGSLTAAARSRKRAARRRRCSVDSKGVVVRRRNRVCGRARQGRSPGSTAARSGWRQWGPPRRRPPAIGSEGESGERRIPATSVTDTPSRAGSRSTGRRRRRRCRRRWRRTSSPYRRRWTPCPRSVV